MEFKTKFEEKLIVNIIVLSDKYKCNNCNCAIIDNKYVFYCVFCDLEENVVIFSDKLYFIGETVVVSFINIDKNNIIEKINVKPKYKRNLVGCYVSSGYMICYLYNGRLKCTKIESKGSSGIISDMTEFTKYPSISVDEVQSLPFESYISDKLIQLFSNRKSIRHKNILIVGAGGSGKTYLIKYLSRTIIETKNLAINTFLYSMENGSIQRYLDEVDIDNGILTIDDIDVISKNPSAVNLFIEYIQRFSFKPVVIIATSREPPYSLPANLSSIFTTAVSFMSLSYDTRKEILKQNLSSYSNSDIEYISKETSGYSYGEFSSIVRNLGEKFDKNLFISLTNSISKSDKPTMMKYSDQPPVVCGYEEAINEIKVILNISFYGTELQNNLLQYHGILLYGPSGNGKSLIIKKISAELNVPFFVVEFDKVFSRYFGESEKAIREVFTSARFYSPSVIVIEDIDALGGKRSDESGVGGRVLSTLLNELDGIVSGSRVVVIATTNKLNLVDSALIRPGRFDRQISIDNPTKEERIKLFHYLRSRSPTDENITDEELSDYCIDYSCSQITSLFRYSALLSLKDNLPYITKDYFKKGLMIIKDQKKNIKTYSI